MSELETLSYEKGSVCFIYGILGSGFKFSLDFFYLNNYYINARSKERFVERSVQERGKVFHILIFLLGLNKIRRYITSKKNGSNYV